MCKHNVRVLKCELLKQEGLDLLLDLNGRSLCSLATIHNSLALFWRFRLLLCTLGALLLIHPPQESNAFHVARLREEIEATHALDLVHARAVLQTANQPTNISGLGVNVAADIAEPLGAVVHELRDERLVAALPGRVDDHGRLVGGELLLVEGVEQGVGVAGDESHRVFGQVVKAGVFAGEIDGLLADVDSDGLVEHRREGDGEESGAAIGVDHVLDW
jgi:hypothetical protein